jgi:capsular polysaccharide biosynthesis protein
MNIDYKLLIDYLKKNLRFIFITTLLTTLLGLIYLIFETPKYEVSTIISANEDDNKVSFESGGLATLVGAGQKKTFIYEFNETIFSLNVVEELNQKENLIFKVFEHLYDYETDSYNQVINLDSVLKKIKFWFYGVNYKAVPNLFMLRDYIKGSVSINFNEFSGLITVSSLTSNPLETRKMINSLLKETDDAFKDIDKFETNAKIDYLYSELSKNKEVNQVAAISNILQNELLKKSLIDSGANYKFKTVRDFEMSEYPVYPNFMFLLLLFTSFGFFGSMAYKLLLFIVKLS